MEALEFRFSLARSSASTAFRVAVYVESLKPRQPDHLDRVKRALFSPQRSLAGGTDNQGHVVELGKCLGLGIANERTTDALWVCIRREQQDT